MHQRSLTPARFCLELRVKWLCGLTSYTSQSVTQTSPSQKAHADELPRAQACVSDCCRPLQVMLKTRPVVAQLANLMPTSSHVQLSVTYSFEL